MSALDIPPVPQPARRLRSLAARLHAAESAGLFDVGGPGARRMLREAASEMAAIAQDFEALQSHPPPLPPLHVLTFRRSP